MTCERGNGDTSMDFSASAFLISMSLLPTRPPLCILYDISKAVLNVRLDVLSEEVAGVALDGGAVPADQELFKVPGNICPSHRFPD